MYLRRYAVSEPEHSRIPLVKDIRDHQCGKYQVLMGSPISRAYSTSEFAGLTLPNFLISHTVG